MKTTKGFTLVELIIVIIIVGILSIVSVTIYRFYTERARLTEAFSILRSIADSNSLYYLEHNTWCTDIRELHVQITGKTDLVDGMYRVETENFVYACAGDSSTSNTIATVNRKPFKEKYWISFAAVPNKQNPNLGQYSVTGDTYNNNPRKTIDKILIDHYKAKYK